MTQEQDNTLIDNYEPFKELGNKRCFTYIAQLIDGKKPKECYSRAKILKLIKLGPAAAKEISQQLFQEKKGDISRAKIAFALKQFLSAKFKSGTKVTIAHIAFLTQISSNFQKFQLAEENLLLFGTQQEIQDY